MRLRSSQHSFLAVGGRAEKERRSFACLGLGSEKRADPEEGVAMQCKGVSRGPDNDAWVVAKTLILCNNDPHS